MKKYFKMITPVLILFLGIYAYKHYPFIPSDLAYSQEYIVGQGNIKGNVDKEKLLKYSKKFEIGANSHGMAVFKDPRGAFNEMIILFPDGINAINREYKLGKISKFNWKGYGVYSWQLSDANDKEREQAGIVGGILDIYENSFER